MTPEDLAYLVAEVKRLRDKVDGMRGGGINNTSTSASFKPSREKRVILPQGGKDKTIAFLITSNATGNAYYNAKSYADPATLPTGGSNLAAADLGTISSTEDCIVANLAELGVSNTGHDVTAATNTSQFAIYGVGRLVGVNANGKKVIETYMPWAGCA